MTPQLMSFRLLEFFCYPRQDAAIFRTLAIYRSASCTAKELGAKLNIYCSSYSSTSICIHGVYVFSYFLSWNRFLGRFKILINLFIESSDQKGSGIHFVRVKK